MDIHDEPTALRGVAVASLTLGFFSVMVSWWFPFGLILSMAGLVLGLFCWALGVHGGTLGERFGLGGIALSGTGFATSLCLGWGTYARLLGF